MNNKHELLIQFQQCDLQIRRIKNKMLKNHSIEKDSCYIKIYSKRTFNIRRVDIRQQLKKKQLLQRKLFNKIINVELIIMDIINKRGTGVFLPIFEE